MGGTGFNDATLRRFYDLYKDDSVAEIPTIIQDINKSSSSTGNRTAGVSNYNKLYFVSKGVKPDVWFSEPTTVWEVRGSDLTKSPTHTAAGGVSLRFPRFVRERPDKTPQSATSSSEIKEMFKSFEEEK